MQSDLTFIPFTNWKEGLSQLLKNLERSNVPKEDSGISVSALLNQGTCCIKQQPETLWSNLIIVKSLPAAIYRFEHEIGMKEADARSANRTWSHYRENSSVCWSFEPPPVDLATRYKFSQQGTCADWRRAAPFVDGRRLRNGPLIGESLLPRQTRISTIYISHHIGLKLDKAGRNTLFLDGQRLHPRSLPFIAVPDLLAGLWGPGRRARPHTVTHHGDRRSCYSTLNNAKPSESNLQVMVEPSVVVQNTCNIATNRRRFERNSNWDLF